MTDWNVPFRVRRPLTSNGHPLHGPDTPHSGGQV